MADDGIADEVLRSLREASLRPDTRVPADVLLGMWAPACGTTVEEVLTEFSEIYGPEFLDTTGGSAMALEYPPYFMLRLKSRWSQRRIAELLSISPSTVARRYERVLIPDEPDGGFHVIPMTGADGKSRPSRSFDTSHRDAWIREQRAAGRSIRAIATDGQCSVGTVHRVLSAGA